MVTSDLPVIRPEPEIHLLCTRLHIGALVATLNNEEARLSAAASFPWAFRCGR